MARSNVLIPALAVALLFFTDLTSAVPAKPIMPRATLTHPLAMATGGTTASYGPSSGFPIQSSNSTINSTPTATPTPKIIMTETNLNGRVIGCTAVSYLFFTNSEATESVSSTSFCIGAEIPLSTGTAMLNSWNARLSYFEPVSAPSSGCKIGNKFDGSNEKYCTCAGSGTASASTASTILGYSRGTLTTACNTGSGSLPTDYVEVPAVTEVNVDQFWAQTPSVLTAGICTTGETLIAECWEDMLMDEYVKWWWGAFNSTCDGAAFAECFYIAMTPYAPSDCSNFNDKSYCKEPSWSDFSGKWNDIRNLYVAFNLYNMNVFITDYYDAIGTAHATASDMVGSIINIIDPIKQQNVVLDDVLTALSIGLAFILGPEGYIGEALVTAAQQAPVVGNFLFPAGTADSQKVEMQEVSANLGQTVKTLQDSVAKALPAMVNDVDSFAAFASTGAFSTFLPSLATLADDILYGLNAYLISQAYQINGVFITRQLNTSVRALMTNGTDLSYQLSCTSDYDENGVCDTFWYDSIDDTTYSFTSGDSEDRTKNYNSDMNTWFSNYTRPEILFRGAADCAAASKSNQGTGSPLKISHNDFNTDCLSTMKVCTWSLTPGKDWDPVFSDCTDDDSFQGVDGSRINPYVGTDICPGVTVDGWTGVDSNPKTSTSANLSPMLSTFRQYLGWGVHKDLADQYGVTFCAAD